MAGTDVASGNDGICGDDVWAGAGTRTQKGAGTGAEAKNCANDDGFCFLWACSKDNISAANLLFF